MLAVLNYDCIPGFLVISLSFLEHIIFEVILKARNYIFEMCTILNIGCCIFLFLYYYVGILIEIMVFFFRGIASNLANLLQENSSLYQPCQPEYLKQ